MALAYSFLPAAQGVQLSSLFFSLPAASSFPWSASTTSIRSPPRSTSPQHPQLFPPKPLAKAGRGIDVLGPLPGAVPPPPAWTRTLSQAIKQFLCSLRVGSSSAPRGPLCWPSARLCRAAVCSCVLLIRLNPAAAAACGGFGTSQMLGALCSGNSSCDVLKEGRQQPRVRLTELPGAAGTPLPLQQRGAGRSRPPPAAS